MGKDLHYTIRPFIEQALMNHQAVMEVEKIENDDYYVYKITRNFDMSEVIIVLSDDYTFNYYSYINKPGILKGGGIFLVARPEAYCFERNETDDKVVVCKLGRLLGSLNKDNFWTYEPPKREKHK